MNLNMISSAFQQLVKFYNQAQRYMGLYKDTSLADLTRLTKVEPLVVISRDCMGLDIMPDLMLGTLNYTISDYTQATEILGKVKDIQVIKTLDKLNPNRDSTGMLLMAEVSNESMTPAALSFSLPTETNESRTLTVEARDNSADSTVLAVGKQVNVSIAINTANGEERVVQVPIAFRLIPRYVSSPQVQRIIGYGVDDTGLIARFQRARDGGIAPFMDFIMAQDLIQEKRKAMIQDDSRVLQEIMTRVATNKRYGLLTNNPSLVTLSNIFVITESEQKALESKFGGSMQSAAVRNRMFENVSASTIIVVNRAWNMVYFYQRGFDSPSEISFKELKVGASKAPDLMDQLKSFNLGMPISMA